ncbi:XRE family transcriptional regulator [Streptomyces corynorhini]|uniref:XRE family transcriptional regulator n=1 Tax=Streptomyces corynorhini TaxID=2282652 RepID=A0A370BEQ0_9ACTN|nr:XRE family transcriptional regulator [Streptomyces corynorhini]
MPASVSSNSVFAMRKVGDELVRLREQVGLRQDDIAIRLGCTRHTVSKIERGKAFPTLEQFEVMMSAYEASPEIRTGIEAKIEEGRSHGRAWFEQPRFRTLYPGSSYRYLSLEDNAERISLHSGTYVPGILQTREYIETLIAFGQAHESVKHRETFLEARMNRKGILSRDNPVILKALCLEAGLLAVVGGPETMRTQLRHLISCAAQPNITLRVIPLAAGAASVASSPFTIMDFPGGEDRSVVSQDLPRGDAFQDDPAEVRNLREKFINLENNALDEEATVQRIEEIEKELS